MTSLYRRRGRPKKEHTTHHTDFGTPELQQKHQQNLTCEPLDLLLKRELISTNEHWCGLHFRWLYTLRYGCSTPQSLDPARIKGRIHKKTYTEWEQEREEEWKEATSLLNEHKLFPHITNLCIHNQITFPLHAVELSTIREGLHLLAKRWCKQQLLH